VFLKVVRYIHRKSYILERLATNLFHSAVCVGLTIKWIYDDDDDDDDDSPATLNSSVFCRHCCSSLSLSYLSPATSNDITGNCSGSHPNFHIFMQQGKLGARTTLGAAARSFRGYVPGGKFKIHCIVGILSFLMPPRSVEYCSVNIQTQCCFACTKI